MSNAQIDEVMRNEYYDFLDGLRESGAVNMFGASPILREEFPELNKDMARKVVSDWMEQF